jgi:predicted flap endonuclease-1-like 5' DNA nuclease
VISETIILEWVNMADLFRIKGIGEEYSELLKEAGVNTVIELARRNPENLQETLVGVNDAKKLVRRPHH